MSHRLLGPLEASESGIFSLSKSVFIPLGRPRAGIIVAGLNSW